MARRGNQPALYERIRVRSGPISPTSSELQEHDEEPAEFVAEPKPAQTFRPARTIRLPIGYLVLAGGVFILFLSVAFMIGHSRGRTAERAEYERTFLAQNPGDVTDPLTTLDVIDERSSSTSGSSAAPPGVPTHPRHAWGPVVPSTDPRSSGYNYFVLAHVNETDARRLADFCRSQGLETYVIPSKNRSSRLRKVVAFPGFLPSKRVSEDVSALEKFIREIGRQWKRKARGHSDLSDMYAELHTG